MYQEEWEDDDPEAELDCDYGFGFCSDPETKGMGLCTTECSVYLESVEEMLKKEEEN